MLRKLLYFGIGAGIGTILVIFMFGGRDDIQCSYFPNDRVLYDIRLKELVVDDHIRCLETCNNLDSTFWQNVLHSGKVDFENTGRGLDSCKTYPIHAQWKDTEVVVNIENCSKKARVQSIEGLNSCSCD